MREVASTSMATTFPYVAVVACDYEAEDAATEISLKTGQLVVVEEENAGEGWSLVRDEEVAQHMHCYSVLILTRMSVCP